MPPGLADAAVTREEVAWSCYSALQSLAASDDVSQEDLCRELVVLVRHITADNGATAAPAVNERTVAEFLRSVDEGLPREFNEFIALYNRLIEWAYSPAKGRSSSAGEDGGGGSAVGKDRARVAWIIAWPPASLGRRRIPERTV